MPKALVIGIDGIDGCGKMTLVNGIIDYYTKKGLKITFLHFPRYDTELGKVIKKVLLKELSFHPSAFQMMCSADRVNWSTYTRPDMIDEYDIILVDRFTSSAFHRSKGTLQVARLLGRNTSTRFLSDMILHCKSL